MSGGADVTDGWNARPTPPPSPGPANLPADQQAWWSDALADPWRDPSTPTAVVMQVPEPGDAPRPEPVVDPNAPRRSLTPVLLICLVTALLAGGLGGTLGYVFAVRGGVGGQGGALGSPAVVPSAANRAPDSLAGVAKKVLPSVITIRVT